MSNERFIKRYESVVDLIWAILCDVNIRSAERVGRIRKFVFELGIGSDQDFFESINWFAVKAISVCVKYSLASSRRMHFANVRYWNQCIVAIVPLLGMSCTFDCFQTHSESAKKLWQDYQKYYAAYIYNRSAI